MAGANQKIEVDFIDKSIALRMSNPTTGVVGSWEYHPVCNIVSITGECHVDFAPILPATNQRKQRYPHDNMSKIIMRTNNPHQADIEFELDDLLIGSQPTWLPTPAGVEVAKADINAWIAQCGSGAGGVDLSDIKACLDILIDNTDDLETIGANSLIELQAINLNTDGIEALLTAGNVNTAAISAELTAQGVQLGTIITSLTTINTSIGTADTNNVAELDAIQVQLTAALALLVAIDGNTDGLEAALAAMNILIAGGNADLALIQTNTLNTVAELVTANATLTSINSQFTGANVITRIDISGVAATVVPAATYRSLQLIVTAGTVTDGTIVYPIGTYGEEAFANKTLSTVTFDGTGATAYLKLMA